MTSPVRLAGEELLTQCPPPDLLILGEVLLIRELDVSNLQLSRMSIVADIGNILEGPVFTVLLLALSVLLEASRPRGR